MVPSHADKLETVRVFTSLSIQSSLLVLTFLLIFFLECNHPLAYVVVQLSRKSYCVLCYILTPACLRDVLLGKSQISAIFILIFKWRGKGLLYCFTFILYRSNKCYLTMTSTCPHMNISPVFYHYSFLKCPLITYG